MSSSNSAFGPYRATALWNEAIMLFKSGMPLTEHRHRLHKHKNSFTGSEAVSFLHKCLKANNLFNSNVTREQVKQLLCQFMASDLICRAESCLNSSEGRFHDSSKYLYKFTSKLETFSPKLPLSNFNARVSRGGQSRGSDNEAEARSTDNNKAPDRVFSEDRLWLNAIVRRIREFMVPLDSPLLIETDKIQSKWVSTNANPKWSKLKWNTELPYWILNAIHNLLDCSINRTTKKTYPKFEIEIFNVIVDYFCTLSSPLIPKYLGGLLLNVFLYIDSLNTASSGNDAALTSSQQQLLMKISTPTKKERNILPPNSCFETAFTSDDPVMRIVPQSAIDIVHLKKWHHRSFNSKTDVNNVIIRRTSSTQFIDEPVRKPLVAKNTNSSEKGFDNKAFAWSPSTGSQQENFSYFPQTNVSRQPGRYMKSVSSDHLDKVHVYFNHGLNDWYEDSLTDDSVLDYKYAIETVNQLVKVSQISGSQSCILDDSASYHTALSESDFEVKNTDDPTEDIPVFVNVENWTASLNKIAVSIFQLLLILLPPSNRAQLKHIMRILHHVPQNATFPELSLKRMTQRLRDSILKCVASSNVTTDVIDQLIAFFAFNYDNIFCDLPSETIALIENEISTEKLKANIFCEQVSKEEFEEQKVSESTTALIQLFHQLLNDKTLSEKERGRHLKAFKDCYPEIYKQETQKLRKPPAKKTIFKPFRL